MLNPHTHHSCGTTSSSGKNTVSLRSTEKAARGNHLGMKNERVNFFFLNNAQEYARI
jgi:hypothetical protein